MDKRRGKLKWKKKHASHGKKPNAGKKRQIGK